jgi:hypothetical protein
LTMSTPDRVPESIAGARKVPARQKPNRAITTATHSVQRGRRLHLTSDRRHGPPGAPSRRFPEGDRDSRLLGLVSLAACGHRRDDAVTRRTPVKGRPLTDP